MSNRRYSARKGAAAARALHEVEPESTVANVMSKQWDGAVVRNWLESRERAARLDQVAAERGGWDRHDDCDKATAEEMVCSLTKSTTSTDTQQAFSDDLRSLLDRDDYVWRGVYDDARFDRHVRSYIKKLIKMAKLNDGFANTAHYQ